MDETTKELKEISMQLIQHSNKILDHDSGNTEKVEKANKRLFIALMTAIIALGIVIIAVVGLHSIPYFYSNYLYPTASQEVKQDNQSITQTVGTTSQKGEDK